MTAIILTVLVLFYGVIFFFDLMFKTCMFFPYIKLLVDNGITIQPFVITWETNRFNQKVRRIASFMPRVLHIWFEIGSIFAMISVLPALIIVCLPFFSTCFGIYEYTDSSVVTNASLKTDKWSSLVMPIIPGITLPFSDVLYYIGAIFISAVVHELGHAVAAAKENMHIESCGIALYFIFPVCFVIFPKGIKHFNPYTQMRIAAAGIWNNVALMFSAIALLWLNPYLLSPAFKYGDGVTVISVLPDSGAGQASGLAVGDQVFAVNDCLISDLHDWEECLTGLIHKPQVGFCVHQQFIGNEEIKVENIMFYKYCKKPSEYLNFTVSNSRDKRLLCLPGRKTVENVLVCYRNEDCLQRICLVPVLAMNERLAKIQRLFKLPVLFLGQVQELYSSVTVTSWMRRFRLLTVSFVVIYEKFIAYLAVISSGLVILNLIPCFGFDGSYIIELFVHLYLGSIFKHRLRRVYIIYTLKCVGFLMGVFAILKVLLKLVFSLSIA